MRLPEKLPAGSLGGVSLEGDVGQKGINELVATTAASSSMTASSIRNDLRQPETVNCGLEEKQTHIDVLIHWQGRKRQLAEPMSPMGWCSCRGGLQGSGQAGRILPALSAPGVNPNPGNSNLRGFLSS